MVADASTRDMLADELDRLLLGPFAADEVLASPPSDTYLTGILWPRGSTLDTAEDDAGALDRIDAESDAPESAVPGYRAMRPCSIGLTFTVDAQASVIVRLDGTARYVPTEATATGSDMPAPPRGGTGSADPVPAPTPQTNASPETGQPPGEQAGRTKVHWVRLPLNYTVSIAADEPRNAWRTSDFVLPDGSRITDDLVALDVRRRAVDGQVTFTVTLINNASMPDGGRERDAAFVFQSKLRVEATNPDGSPAIRPRRSRLLADDEDGRSNLLLYRNVHEFAVGHGVAVEWEPGTPAAVSRVATTWTPRTAVSATSASGHASLEALTRRDPHPFAAAWLSRHDAREEVTSALDELVDLYRKWIASALAEGTPGVSGDLAAAAAVNRARCLHTASRLSKGVEALRRFPSAWRAFVLANQAMDMQARFAARGERARPLVWRPFQIAFMLLVIPSLVDPSDESRDCMDLLWFPTGGGKTEAYLALAAFQIFLRRLQSEQRRSEGGVDVMMRYTLRLLTIQQFQRAAALITACELIRRDDVRALGTAPISLGLYVGGDSTPNRIEEARRRLDEERAGEQPASTPRQLLRCPVCGDALNASSYRVPLDGRRIEIRCANTRCLTKGEPLPFLTVDELIYTHPPSLLIGTVDKFAQLPRREDIRTLFGLGGRLPPALIIQDELHLISGPLGSMAGLYESAIDLLCADGSVRPKIVGSTATIGRAAAQVRALFDRDVLQFPPPGIDASDSFFAVRDESGPDRLYVGVTTAGRSPKFALQAVIAALLQTAYVLKETGRGSAAAVDPYWTCVAYFNSLRELGGAHVLMLDDVPRQIQFLAKRLGASPRPTEGPPIELSSRVPSREIPRKLFDLERDLQTAERDEYAQDPAYAVLASNMISVGVDVPRLGLMVVNGQPKSTAEYIQASSRVGRGVPGLVVTLYNFGRPRDLSHFEHFRAYHGALYRDVEATSVTPWAPRARDKALHAAFVALVRHLVPGMSGDDSAISFDASLPEVERLIDALAARAGRGSDGMGQSDTRRDLQEVVKVWQSRVAESRAAGKALRYWERRAPYGNTAPHLMRAAEDTRRGPSSAWPTPNSMREIEPSTAFVLHPQFGDR